MEKIRKRLTYANVMSSIAVFLVIGGATAFAALGKNTVGTKQLKKNAVTAAKIKNGAVNNAKLAPNAVTGDKVADGSLTGVDINLSSLGTVPKAALADKATTATSATTANKATVANAAFSTNSGNDILPFNGSAGAKTTVATLAVPAGNYVILGKVLGNNNSAASVLGNCQLEAGGTVIDNGFDSFRLGKEAEGDRAYVPLAGTAALPSGGSIEIKCSIGSTEGNWLNRVITATQVASIG